MTMGGNQDLQGRRRWVLPVYVALLALWFVATVVSWVVFGGPSSPVYAISMVVTFLILAVGLYAEWRYRREQRR